MVQAPSVYKMKLLKITLIVSIIGGIFLIYFLFNPSSHSFFVPCPFKYLTGYHCPGCGSQRAIHQMLHGNLVSAFRLNPLLTLSLPLIFFGLGTIAWNFIYDTNLRVKLFYSNRFIYVYFGIVLVYWILRNIPFVPFNYLAPPA